MRTLLPLWTPLVAATLAAGCGQNKSAVAGPAAEPSPGVQKLSDQISEAQQANEKATKYDLNHDGTPDVFSYSVPGKAEDGREIQRVVRKELDLNFDGKVDITKFYGETEQVEREAYDLDFDGKLDQVNFYEKGVVVRKERDLDYNNQTDLWLYLEKGKIVRKERDTNGDGKVDYWEYWENDQVERAGEDLDGDGSVDRWIRNPEASASGG
jgi:antitoxin component YwqK of YwqJK toxin-antitoxin module